MYILRAGITGCLAALKYPKAEILDPGKGPEVKHQALLRMGSRATEKLTGIELREVTVSKYIYKDEVVYDFCVPTDVVNYSKKVSGKVSDRSIGRLGYETRYIPPEDFAQQLLDKVRNRIQFDLKVIGFHNGYIETEDNLIDNSEPIISTLPMEENLSAVGITHNINFGVMSFPIFVTRLRLKNYDMNATIYFPEPKLGVYRASMIGSILIVEATQFITTEDIYAVRKAFSIEEDDISEIIIENKQQNNGKIIPVDDSMRKQLLYEMTQKANLYSLGRFACWRQILLDDSVQDLNVIENMINTHPYDRNRL